MRHEGLLKITVKSSGRIKNGIGRPKEDYNKQIQSDVGFSIESITRCKDWSEKMT